jgi:hypothetical protein
VSRSRSIGALLAAAAALLPAGALAATAADPAGTGSAPAASPATPSPFRADRAASQPVGLLPDDARNPLAYPDQPIVLRWSPVPGAVSYKVEVASNPGFTRMVWSSVTDQAAIAPNVLFADGAYWWRVSAVDAAGTVGLASMPARFAKAWPSSIAGAALAASPGGPAATVVDLTPYLSWQDLPGAKEYEVQLAPADQFAVPSVTILHDHAPFFSPGASVGLAADTYAWRVRARDPQGNPGPWTLGGSFTKVWAPPAPLAPSDGVTTAGLHLRWAPVSGAESYQAQVTNVQDNWDGSAIKLTATTANTALVPTASEQAGLPAGTLWWRVRAKTGSVASAWSAPLRVVYAPAPATSGAAVTLTPVADIRTALPPDLTWTPIVGATVYRVDIATDNGFTNVVHSQVTQTPAWAPRSPLPDNQVGTGYFWRVVPGDGDSSAPHWLIAEALVPVGTFDKQTQVTLAQGASGLVDAPPLLTWDAVSGSARYEVQLSQSQQFDAAAGEGAGSGGGTIAATVWGFGFVPGSQDAGARLADGTWYWRVRAVDAAGSGQAWSPVGSFTLTSPRPAPSLPADGATVVASPEMRWSAVPQACSYALQLKDGPALTDTDSVIATAQTALVPTGDQVTHPGRWYWRVRADYCDGVNGQWSPTRSFQSARPADFGLNSVPARSRYGSRVIVSGALSFGGVRVRKPTLVLQRRAYPEGDYRFFGTVRADAEGRFALRLTSRRTAAYRLRWPAAPGHPEGQAAFSIQVQPRVQLNLSASKAVRRSAVVASGFVFPARRAELQVQTAQGWETLRTLRPGASRFKVGVGSGLEPGQHRVRLLVPGDQRLATTRSAAAPLMVYDRFVIRGTSR